MAAVWAESGSHIILCVCVGEINGLRSHVSDILLGWEVGGVGGVVGDIQDGASLIKSFIGLICPSSGDGVGMVQRVELGL